MPDAEQKYLALAYTEVCRSYQSLHEFRMKLLGLLPIVSIAAFVALDKSAGAFPPPESLEAKLIGYIGLFSALFTLALFIYEARGILMCYDLYYTGAQLETQMNVLGQFRECDETRGLACYSEARRRYAFKINNKVASAAIYSLTFAAWFFVSLRFVFHVELENCALWAGGVGLVLAVIAVWGLDQLTASPKKPKAPIGAQPKLST